MKNQTYMQSMQALGTVIEFRVVASSMLVAEEWFSLLWKEVVAFENAFSRFKPGSELSLFNAQAGKKVLISEMCKKMFEKAKQFGEITDGMFNPFVLPMLHRAGYVHSMTNMENNSPDYSARDIPSCTELEIGGDWARIPENSALDLGGIGKGFLADHLASLLTPLADNYCLSLGGDIIAKGNDEFGQKWSIDIESSEDCMKRSAYYISEESMFGLATSGMVRKKEGKKQMHQIHPSSDTYVKSPYTLCTVAAKDATTADVLASSVLIGGEKFANQMMQEQLVHAIFLQGEKNVASLILGKGFTLI